MERIFAITWFIVTPPPPNQKLPDETNVCQTDTLQVFRISGFGKSVFLVAMLLRSHPN